jgi:hypothetical protein
MADFNALRLAALCQEQAELATNDMSRSIWRRLAAEAYRRFRG